MSRGSSSGGSAFGVLVLLGIVLWIVSLILRYIGPILGLLAIAASIYGARALLRDNLRRKEEYDEYCAQVAATADKQNDWVRQGDMRGVFGPDAADLMDYVRDDGTVTPPARPVTAVPVVPPLTRARQAAPAALVAGGVGAALLLAQIPGVGSDDSSSTRSSTTSSRTSYPTYSPTTTPTWETPVTTYYPTTSAAPTTSYSPTPETTTVYVPVPPPQQTSTAVPIVPFMPSTGGDVYYRSCAAARADGRSNIPAGAPGYRPGLDRDGDGFACES